jgi:hypothetical protein
MNRAAPKLRIATVVGALALVAACSACGGSADAQGAPKTKARVTTTTATTTTMKKVNPAYDSGDTVTITATGFEPKVLIADVKVPLTFVNTTSSVQHVQFEHSRDANGTLIASGAIAPGKSWSYTPQSWESATYHSIDQPTLRGQIQIQPPAEP